MLLTNVVAGKAGFTQATVYSGNSLQQMHYWNQQNLLTPSHLWESSSKWLQKVTCRVRCRAWSKLPAVQCQLFCFTSSMNKSTGCLYQQARELFLTGLQKQHLNLSGFSYLTGSGRLAKSLIPEQCMGQRKMSSILWVNPIFNWWKFRKLLPRR